MAKVTWSWRVWAGLGVFFGLVEAVVYLAETIADLPETVVHMIKFLFHALLERSYALFQFGQLGREKILDYDSDFFDHAHGEVRIL